MRWSPGLVLLVGACGRLGFDPVGSPTLDDSRGGSGPDGDSAAVVDLGPFAAPVQQTSLSTARDEQGPSLTADLLEIYFGSSRNCINCSDIFVAKRALVTDPWGPASEVVELTNAARDMAPEISPDGLTLWYASERQSPAGGADIWITTRPDRQSAWAAPVRETSLSTAGYDLDPALSEDGLMMTLTSDGAGGTNAAIYIATRASPTAAWTTPTLIGELDGPLHDSAASPRDGGRTLYLGHEVTSGQFDIFVATRSSTTSPFGGPVLLDNLNAGTLDFDAWVSADQHTIFFASDRTGNFEIYEATR